ncbi:MAG: creatininase family protein [Candidatus Dormibacteraeota bacterium]|nr:creatininase family protein [Candidatus Dormibacteraeota bacterium]
MSQGEGGAPAPLHFAELTSPAAGALRGAATVLLLPVGAVEPHGPHAPLDTDSIISMEVAEAAARELAGDPALRVLVLPPIGYGVTRYAAAFPGAVSLSPGTLEALVSEVTTAVRDQGYAHVVIVNSHFEPEHVAALRRAAEGSGAVLFDVTRRRMAERLTDEFRSGAAHAGRYETSLVLATRPGLVDGERMRTLPSHFVDMPAAMASGKTDFIAMDMHEAYCGAPAEATAEEGASTFTTLTTMLVELIREQV